MLERLLGSHAESWFEFSRFRRRPSAVQRIRSAAFVLLASSRNGVSFLSVGQQGASRARSVPLSEHALKSRYVPTCTGFAGDARICLLRSAYSVSVISSFARPAAGSWQSRRSRCRCARGSRSSSGRLDSVVGGVVVRRAHQI